MIPEEHRVLLDYLWDREDPDDPESMEWRDDLDAEETALVESWDQAYARGVGTLVEDILAMEKGR